MANSNLPPYSAGNIFGAGVNAHVFVQFGIGGLVGGMRKIDYGLPVSFIFPVSCPHNSRSDKTTSCCNVFMLLAAL